MRKLLLFLVPLIAIGIAYSWWTGQAVSTAEDSTPAEDNNTQAVTSDPAATVIDKQAEPATEESEGSSESVASDSLQNEAEADNTANEESPFTVVEQPADPSSTEAVVDPSSGDKQPTVDTGAVADAAADTDGQAKETVVVPESYPVTDAEKYFVPKDQRSPGNLGGPPPLDFPGGPSDPNRIQPGSDIAAPAAPGQ